MKNCILIAIACLLPVSAFAGNGGGTMGAARNTDGGLMTLFRAQNQQLISFDMARWDGQRWKVNPSVVDTSNASEVLLKALEDSRAERRWTDLK